MVNDKISHKNIDCKKSAHYDDMFCFIKNDKK